MWAGAAHFLPGYISPGLIFGIIFPGLRKYISNINKLPAPQPSSMQHSMNMSMTMNGRWECTGIAETGGDSSGG